MADPLSVTASIITLVTVTVQSVKALHGTVSRFKGRDKTLQRLQDELQGIIDVLESLKELADEEVSISKLLHGPIGRCSKVCEEFEQSMKTFSQNSKTSFRDWTKLEFMKGDINEFISTIAGYKSTITVGLGTITIREAKVSQKALDDYNEMIQDTMYTLNVHLQRVDEKLEIHSNPAPSTSSINLDDEKEVTRVCLRICEDAKKFLESLNQNSTVLQGGKNDTGNDEQQRFEARLLTRQALDKNQENLANTIAQLQVRLTSLILNNDPEDAKERSRLLEDINASRQCLEVCKLATEVTSQKIYRVGEVIADGDSDQVVVTTLADLFDVKKAISKGNSTQLVGSMTDASLRDLTEKRYGSRFGTYAPDVRSAQTSNSPAVTNESRRERKSSPHTTEGASNPQSRFALGRPLSNEVRKRRTSDEQQ